jgi:hypothetical protein
MQLDPVFVAAPRKPPPSMTNRRAFLGMGLTFVAGNAIGAACGYSAGAAARPPDPTSRSEGDLKPTGDNDLEELRRLAVKAPIEELVEKNLLFFVMLDRSYRNDPVLWRGVARLSAEVVSNDRLKDRAMIARRLVVAIENIGAPPELRLDQRLPSLRAAAR